MKVHVFLVALLMCCAVYACAEQPMTIDQALERARTRAPQIVAAQLRVDEARGRLAGASMLLQENPTVEAVVGPRYSSNGDTNDYEFTVSQSFELGGRRSARIAGAGASVAREVANAQSLRRQLLRDVALSFARALAGKERLRISEEASKTADELLDSMKRRYEAGDVPVLDVNLSRNTASRARAEVTAAHAAYVSAIGELRLLLGMTNEEQLDIAGDLKRRERFDVNELLARSVDRPALRALDAEREEARAEVRLGEASRWPTVAPAFSYKRDQGDRVVQGGLNFMLPFFNHGQELRSVGQARARRLEAELDATKRAVSVEVRTAFDVYALQLSAIEELERDALPSVVENETLARRSFEEGEIGLAELLLVRRDASETRLVYVDRLLDTAIAAIELQFRAGVLQ